MSRKGQILKSGLLLFSKEGFHATSTRSISNHAGVSEGLIFRHFQSKEGLLFELLSNLESRMSVYHDPILKNKDPQSAIFEYIHIPFGLNEIDIIYWRLFYKLKWEVDFNQKPRLLLLSKKLNWAFSELGSLNPELETEWLISQMEGISQAVIKNSFTNKLKMKNFLIKKYTF